MTERDLAALGSLFNGGLTGKREQRIYTPRSVVLGLRRLWPEGVALDPCHGPDSIVDADRVCFPEHEDPESRDGLAVEWPRRTYTNPPYDNLAPWLSRFSRSPEVVALVPVRTHRRWYRDALAACDAVCLLDPLTFGGFDQSFPAPLSLLYRGGDPEGFAAAFATLGDTHVGPIGRPSRQASFDFD